MKGNLPDSESRKYNEISSAKRIGIAKGKLSNPVDLDADSEAITLMFESNGEIDRGVQPS